MRREPSAFQMSKQEGVQERLCITRNGVPESGVIQQKTIQQWLKQNRHLFLSHVKEV